MTGTLLATWIRLRRPRFLFGTYGAIGAMTLLFTALLFLSATAEPAATQTGPAGAGGLTLADLAQAGGLTQGLTNAVSLLGIVALCVAAAQIASEFTQGTLRNLLVRQPHRLRLRAGVWLALATFTAGAVAVATAVSAGVGFALAGVKGIDTSAWTTVDGMAASGETAGLVLLAVVGYATLGLVLGLLLRAPVPAIVLGVAWLLVIEQVLAAFVDGAGRWLPGQLLSAVASGGTADVGLAAAATIVVYLAAGAAAAAVTFVRRDMTAWGGPI